MANLALLDLALPYIFRGENLGPTHAALSALRVVQFETATDDFGVALRGHCEVNGSLDFFPSSGTLVAGAVDEAAPPHDPSRSEPIFDLRDTTIDFELFVPRQASEIVTAAQARLNASAADTTALLNDLAAATPSDYPSTGFIFDLILNAPKIRPPFLHPAKVSPIGTLMPDDSVQEVALVLPRLRFRFSHGNATGSQLVLSFVGAGVSSLDDPGSVEVSQFLSMEPPYAYIGGADSRVVGIGFRSGTLDLDACTMSTSKSPASAARIASRSTGRFFRSLVYADSPGAMYSWTIVHPSRRQRSRITRSCAGRLSRSASACPTAMRSRQFAANLRHVKPARRTRGEEGPYQENLRRRRRCQANITMTVPITVQTTGNPPTLRSRGRWEIRARMAPTIAPRNPKNSVGRRLRSSSPTRRSASRPANRATITASTRPTSVRTMATNAMKARSASSKATTISGPIVRSPLT